MKKLSLLLVTTVLSQILSGCTISDQSLTGKDKLIPMSNSAQDAMGTGDGGGGNALNYKMLESHLINPNDLEVVKVRVAPLLEKIFPSKDPQVKLDMFALKNWYLAPIKLKTLPKDVLGVDFTSDRMQQVAIQTELAVWIDSNYFEKMNEDEKARLIVHELLMNIYMTRFLSLGELCDLTLRTGQKSCGSSMTPEFREKLESQYKPEERRRLIDSDYEAIRAATAWVFANEKTLTESAYQAYTKRIGFADKRFGGASNEGENVDQKLKPTHLSKIVTALRKAQLSGSLQKTCSGLHTKRNFNCELVWSVSEKSHDLQPALKTQLLEVSFRDSDSGEVVQKSSMEFANGITNLSRFDGSVLLTLMSPDFWRTQQFGYTSSYSALSFKMDDDDNLTLNGVILFPLIYVDTEKTEKVQEVDGLLWKEICETRVFSRTHPESLRTDSIVLMTHTGDTKSVNLMNLTEIMPMKGCQTVRVTPENSK